MLIMVCNQWYRVPAAMLQDERLNRSDVAVFAVIADRCDGEETQLTRAEIAAAAACSAHTVSRAVAHLCELHYIAVQACSGGASIYRQLVLEPKRRGRGSGARSEGASASIEEYKSSINAAIKGVS